MNSVLSMCFLQNALMIKHTPTTSADLSTALWLCVVISLICFYTQRDIFLYISMLTNFFPVHSKFLWPPEGVHAPPAESGAASSDQSTEAQTHSLLSVEQWRRETLTAFVFLHDPFVFTSGPRAHEPRALSLSSSSADRTLTDRMLWNNPHVAKVSGCWIFLCACKSPLYFCTKIRITAAAEHFFVQKF